MINFNAVTLRRGARVLFAQASFILHKGQRVGVVGANGAGKSSLFALVRGELHPDEGDCSLLPHLTLAHVAQETPAVDRPALEYVIDGDLELRRLQRQLAQAERDGDGLRQAELHAALEAAGGYGATARAARLLDGLGFGAAQQQRPVRAFSGGWRMRLNLAQALMCRSDVLLLDEPTNHLDLDAVLWLQDWLGKYPGTLLLIAHDRDFLDAVVGHIVHIDQGKAVLHTGNYSAFERARAERLAQQQAAHLQQQRQIAHIQRFVDRFKAQATKARQAQSRIKALERMALIAGAHVDSPFTFAFKAPGRLPNPLLKLEAADIGYPGHGVLKQVALTIVPGDRIGLLGPNGAGKSSLIKALAGELPPLAGRRLAGEALRIGYFAQHQLEQLSLEHSPLWHLQRQDPKACERGLRQFLGGFDFQGDQALAPVRPFSGGEKARLVLALLVYQNPNLLLLDEPTNHLDLEMRHALTVALQDYAGALVVVSHDRHLLGAVTDRLLLVADGQARAFDGDLEDYRLWLGGQKAAAHRAANGHHAAAPPKRQPRKPRQKALLDAVSKAEQAMERHHGQQQALALQLADGALYAGGGQERLAQLLAQKAAVDLALAAAEADWLAAQERLQEAGRGPPAAGRA